MLIPDLLPLNLAARLVGLSPACFREVFIATGQIEYKPDGPAGRFQLERASLERALGRAFTDDEYKTADRSLAPRRIQQKQYRRFNPHVVDVR
jgi:hypothetical protein